MIVMNNTFLPQDGRYDDLIEFHKQEFLMQGGIREEMTRGRLAYRQNNPPPRPSVPTNTSLSQRAQQLDAREARIAQKEQELTAKEQELIIREQEIARLLRLATTVGSDRE